MSLIVGIEQMGKVYMGSDSLSINGSDRRVLPHGKIFKVDEYIIGYAGTMRAANLLTNFDYPENINELPELVLEYMKDHDCTYDACDEEGASFKMMNAALLIGYKGHLYELPPDCSLIRRVENYVAIGAASAYAYGVLYITEHTDLLPEQRIKLALKAGAKFSAVVGGKIYIDKM